MDDVNEIISEAIGGEYTAGRLVAFGEAYVLLSADGHDRLERANTVNIAVGGPELNAAAAYACLGLDAMWVSTVADSAFGRRKLRAARAANIDTRFVTIGEGRTGIKFVDPGVQPRQQSTLVDTANSAFSRHRSGSYDWDAIFNGAAALFVSGSTLGVSASVRQDAIDAMSIANHHGLIVAFELDYQPGSWTEAEARRTFSGIVRHTDVLFSTRSALETFFGIEGSYDATLRMAIERLGVAAVAMRRERSRGNGRIALEGLAMGKNGTMSISRSYTVELVNSGGAEHAFAAGFLAGYMQNPSAISRSTELASAMSALVQTTNGEILIANRSEIERLMDLG